MVPILLLHKPRGTGSVGRDELARRADDLAVGRWKDLLAEALRHPPRQVHAPLTEGQEELRRVHNAQARIQLGQVFRARHILTGAALAPRTGDTFNLLQDRTAHSSGSYEVQARRSVGVELEDFHRVFEGVSFRQFSCGVPQG